MSQNFFILPSTCIFSRMIRNISSCFLAADYQITETKLKEQSVFGNQLICISNTILMLEPLHLWPTNHPWAFMFPLYWGAEPHSIHGQLQQCRIMMECRFWVNDRLRPCKHISLMSPSSIFNVELSARVGEQQHPVPTCFVDCNFFLQFNYINRNVSHHHMSDLQLWLSGQSVALNKREIDSSDSSGVLLP